MRDFFPHFEACLGPGKTSHTYTARQAAQSRGRETALGTGHVQHAALCSHCYLKLTGPIPIPAAIASVWEGPGMRKPQPAQRWACGACAT